MDPYKIIVCPIVTEAIFDDIEEYNKLVFIVNPKATRTQVKKAIEEMYEVKVVKVNTTNTYNGKKKAYVRLHPDYDALSLATEFGLF